MTQQELIKSVAQSLSAPYPELKISPLVVRMTLGALGDVAAAELLGGGEVPLPGIGKLKLKNTAARKGRNPKTGETMNIPAGKKVGFTTCKELKEALKP